MKQIVGLHETRLKDIEARSLEVQVAHTRIDIQKGLLKSLVEMLSDVIPEENRAKLAGFLADDKAADQLARIKNSHEFMLDQQAAQLADFRAAIERMPDE